MHNTAVRGAACTCCVKRVFRLSTTILLFCFAQVFSGILPAGAAQAPQNPQSAAAATAPSAGKALICIYRISRFVGSASHDHLYVNDVFLATLLNGEYAWTEAPPGTVVVSGLTKMYYGGIIQSTGAALNEARKKENERIRIDAEAGKTYYLKMNINLAQANK